MFPERRPAREDDSEDIRGLGRPSDPCMAATNAAMADALSGEFTCCSLVSVAPGDPRLLRSIPISSEEGGLESVARLGSEVERPPADCESCNDFSRDLASLNRRAGVRALVSITRLSLPSFLTFLAMRSFRKLLRLFLSSQLELSDRESLGCFS